MTRRMREVLEEAVRQELRRVERETWPANHSTLAALVRRGLLERSERRSRNGARLVAWTVTKAGEEALAAPERVVVEKPRYMAHGAIRYRVLPNNRWAVADDDVSGDYTNDPSRAFDRAEVDEPSLVWRRRSEVKQLQAQDRKARARKAAEKARYAA